MKGRLYMKWRLATGAVDRETVHERETVYEMETGYRWC